MNMLQYSILEKCEMWEIILYKIVCSYYINNSINKNDNNY